MMWKIALPWVLLMAFDQVRSNEISSHQVRRRDQDLKPAAETSSTHDSRKSCPKNESFVCHYDTEHRSYKSICVSNVATHLKQHPKDLRGRCEDACKNVVDDCDDGDLCTKDSTVCNATTGFKKVCVFSPITCKSGNSCNSADGLCQADDQLVPCVAVIDEDSSFKKHAHGHNQAQLWKDFRAAYPDRPFCLLVPGHSGHVHTPQDFLNDPLVTVHYNVAQDFGDASKAEDWAALCGLDSYTSANVPMVGLFLDNSGHKHKDMVTASRDLFYKDMKAKGMAVKEFVNSDENWMLPFMKTLA